MSSAVAITAATGGFTESAFAAFLNSRDEPGWLVDRRREAFAVFQSLPLPTARDEEWRRTDVRALKLDAFAPPTASADAASDSSSLAPVWSALSANYANGI